MTRRLLCVGRPCTVFHHLFELVFRRNVLLFTFRRSTLRPACEEFELFGSECLIVAEIAETFHGAPGRHSPFEDFFFDRGSPGERFLVLHQSERSSTGAMTRN